MKVYVCPCGPELSIWKRHDSRYAYIISSRMGGGGLDAPVWATSLPLTVSGDAMVALWVMQEFTKQIQNEVFSVFHKSELIPALYGSNNPA
jgi:hypothetical protein